MSATVTDIDPNNTGVVCWRDDGKTRGRLVRVEVHQDRHDAELRRERLTGAKYRTRVLRRDLRADGARLVVYVVIVRERKR